MLLCCSGLRTGYALVFRPANAVCSPVLTTRGQALHVCVPRPLYFRATRPRTLVPDVLGCALYQKALTRGLTCTGLREELWCVVVGVCICCIPGMAYPRPATPIHNRRPHDQSAAVLFPERPEIKYYVCSLLVLLRVLLLCCSGRWSS